MPYKPKNRLDNSFVYRTEVLSLSDLPSPFDELHQTIVDFGDFLFGIPDDVLDKVTHSASAVKLLLRQIGNSWSDDGEKRLTLYVHNDGGRILYYDLPPSSDLTNAGDRQRYGRFSLLFPAGREDYVIANIKNYGGRGKPDRNILKFLILRKELDNGMGLSTLIPHSNVLVRKSDMWDGVQNFSFMFYDSSREVDIEATLNREALPVERRVRFFYPALVETRYCKVGEFMSDRGEYVVFVNNDVWNTYYIRDSI